jgi:hypothetical protein
VLDRLIRSMASCICQCRSEQMPVLVPNLKLLKDYRKQYWTMILQGRDSRGLGVRCTQGHHLEGPVAVANNAQQGLRVSRFWSADDSNLSWLRKGVRQRLERLPEVERILVHHGLQLYQRPVLPGELSKSLWPGGHSFPDRDLASFRLCQVSLIASGCHFASRRCKA